MSNVYRIYTEIAMANKVSGVLAAITADMTGMLLLQGKLEKGFASMNMALVGIVPILAGGGILKGVLHFEEAAESLVHAETVLKAGLPDATRAIDMQIARTTAYAEAGQNLNTTLSGNIEHLHDLYNVVQSMQHAADLLPTFNKLSNAFQFVGDAGAKAHGSDSKQIAAAARAFELTGRTTPEAIEAISGAYVKSVIGLRARVDGDMLFQAVSTAGGGRYGWSDEFVAQGLPTLANVMKSRTGSSLYNFWKNLYQGNVSSYSQAQLQEKWFLHSADDEQRDPKTGKFQGFKVGSVFNADLAGSDPQKWALSYRDLLKDKGVNVDDLKTMIDVTAEISRGNKLLGAILDEYILPNPSKQLSKERFGNIGQVSNDAAGIINEDDPRAWRQKLAKQWTNFEEAVGVSVVPLFIKNVLEPLTKALRDMSQWAIIHPTRMKYIIEGIAGIGAALVGLGVLAVGGALYMALGPVGWLLAGLGGLATAVAILKEPLLEATKPFMKKAVGGLLSVLPTTEYESEVYAHELMKDFLTRRRKAAAPLPSGGNIHKISNTITLNLDGRQITRAVVDNLVRSSTFQTSVGGQDTRGTWLSPGAMVSA